MKRLSTKLPLLLAGAFAAVVCLITAPARAADQEDVFARIASATVKQHIIPRYERLAEAGTVLATAARDYCAGHDEAAFQSLDMAFRSYWLRWADIRHIQFGPVTYLDRAFRIQFWPDTRNRIGKSLQRTLSAADNAALAPERFSKTSVAIQGLPALERLLAEGTAPFSGEKGAFRCALTEAITSNLATISAGIVENWGGELGFAHSIAEAGSGSGPYSETYEVPVDILQSLLGEIEASRDLRIGRPMGSAIDTARPKLAEAWRSGLSRDILRHSLEGAEDLYMTGGFDAALKEANAADIALRIRGGFAKVEADLAALEGSLYDAFSSEAGRTRLGTIRADMKTLSGLIGTDLAVALDISPGFNSRDGD